MATEGTFSPPSSHALLSTYRCVARSTIMSATKCANCGYTLYGITAPSCPECGLTLDAAARRKRSAVHRVMWWGVASITGTYLLGLVVSCFWADQSPLQGGSYGAHFPFRRATTWPFFFILTFFPISIAVLGLTALLVLAALRPNKMAVCRSWVRSPRLLLVGFGFLHLLAESL